jgi:hypothetical protein
MILLCQACGWRINQRNTNIEQPLDEIGKHLIYNNKPFCSERCIEKAKTIPHILSIIKKPTDWDEPAWKIERKIDRIRPMRKLSKIYKSKKQLYKDATKDINKDVTVNENKNQSY